MSAPLTIKQRTLAVEIDGSGRIVVRRMVWRAARDLLTLLAEHRDKLGSNMQEAWSRLPELLRTVDAIVEHLVLNSTDLTKEQYDQLDMVAALAVLEAALELNLGDELKNSCVGIAHKLAGLAAGWMPTTPGASSTPSSSMPATAPTTSTAAPSTISS